MLMIAVYRFVTFKLRTTIVTACSSHY